ncbi:glycoside-pentoside-hexuronide (GPH):cation symporter [Terrilactibacillus laevilacticus]|uniref:Glycoside-pentoside-hexuronide (GPH):cation symporter n=1 Tax=Terrilactibacillus laevilacticus TaxID=1380157 RepID=A0ABW5PVC8_9BACI|nr:glycoside-pentoside-hexuronide (GPH):cation symporter [Terrilactibacillus laevilacticus]
MLEAEQTKNLKIESKLPSNVNGRLTWIERFGFGSGDMSYNIVFQFVNAYLLFFYTDVDGIKPEVIATLFLVVRVFDAICDPLMGTLLDKTNTRWGKARPFLLWVAVPLAASTFLCFTTPNFGSSGNIIYAYVTYILLGMFFSVQTISVNSLTGRITDNVHERTVLTTVRMILVYIGILLAISCATPLVKLFGGDNASFGFQMTSLVYAVAGLLLNVFSFMTVKERVVIKKPKKQGLKKTIQVLLKNKPLIILISTFLMFSIGFNIRLSTMVYYFTYNIHREDLVFIGTVLFFGAAFLSNLFIPTLTKRWGRKSVVIISATISLISFAGLQFTSYSSIMIILVWLFICGFFSTPLNTLAWGMLADCVDYAEWKTNVRADGVVISSMSFVNKLGVAVAGTFSAYYLGYSGYVANSDQTLSSLNAIKNMNASIPGILTLLSIIIFCFYPLSEKKYKKMMSDLKKKRKPLK